MVWFRKILEVPLAIKALGAQQDREINFLEFFILPDDLDRERNADTEGEEAGYQLV